MRRVENEITFYMKDGEKFGTLDHLDIFEPIPGKEYSIGGEKFTYQHRTKVNGVSTWNFTVGNGIRVKHKVHDVMAEWLSDGTLKYL